MTVDGVLARPVPEPSTFVFFGMGLLLLMWPGRNVSQFHGIKNGRS